MRLHCHLFWGVPCCDRLHAPRIVTMLKSVPHLSFAPSVLQADTLIVVGSISKKQAPFLIETWSCFPFPARSIHLSGCDKAIHSYALIRHLSQVLNPTFVVNSCSDSEASIAQRLLETKP